MRISAAALGLVFVTSVLAGCAQAGTAGNPDTDSANAAPIFFNITSGPDDPHPVTMALQLAGHALDDNRSAVLFFNVRGVHIPTTQLPDTLAFGDRPIKEMLVSLMERGAEVHVCPHCMAALGVEAADLISGAQVTNRDMLFAHLNGNTAVFTY
ncbi:DsrE family protein [Gemmatimonadota bacterium]